ncbi:MAG: aspartate carbamoyltransferase, partial [Gammaproteobacteria bacterium]
MDFRGQHILSVSQFDRQAIEQIIAVADRMKPYAERKYLSKVLDGAILGNMFFEPST